MSSTKGSSANDTATIADTIKSSLNEVDIELQLTNLEAMVEALFQQAKKGNLKAFELIRESVGEKPTAAPLPQEVVILMADAMRYGQ